MKQIMASTSTKTKRLSTVALSGAVLAVVWSIGDQMVNAEVPAVVVSSITSLVMLVAGFYDPNPCLVLEHKLLYWSRSGQIDFDGDLESVWRTRRYTYLELYR